MSEKNHIRFLGTAGGRYVVSRQLRSSAGTYLALEGERLILDPGPGTLVKCAAADPVIDVSKLTGVVLTHGHIDHAGDANVVIDAITGGGFTPGGTLFAPHEALYGENAVVLKYLRPFLNSVQVLRETAPYALGTLRFRTSVRHRHGVETYGIVFELPRVKVGFMVDTQYFADLAESYRGCDVLIMNVVLHDRDPSGCIQHLTLPDVPAVVEAVRPSQVVITHLGGTMLQAHPPTVASTLARDLHTEVTAAFDGMVVELE